MKRKSTARKFKKRFPAQLSMKKKGGFRRKAGMKVGSFAKHASRAAQGLGWATIAGALVNYFYPAATPIVRPIVGFIGGGVEGGVTTLGFDLAGRALRGDLPGLTNIGGRQVEITQTEMV